MSEDFIIPYNISYNNVVVIQSLRIGDRPTGKELYDNIIRRYCDLKETIAYYREVGCKSEFDTVLSNLVRAVKNHNNLPILHLEIHGGKVGLELSNGELVSWEELASYLREINIVLKNNLLVTLAVCKGIMLYQAADFYQPAPFWGIIGPKHKVGDTTLLTDFTEFYSLLLRHSDMQGAVDILNQNKEGYEYALLTSPTMIQLLEELSTARNTKVPDLDEMRKIFLME
jgi:hypothetical protein